jgi:hypothetical protein
VITDFVTGKPLPNIGAEEARQTVEQFLVREKGYDKSDIEVDVDIVIIAGTEPYRSQVDLVVRAQEKRVMAFKCAAGSLSSREREILSAARLLDSYQIPLSVVSDGKTAIILDTVSGKKIHQGLEAVPSKTAAKALIRKTELQPVPAHRLEREKLVFRSYDMMNVNVQRNME